MGNYESKLDAVIAIEIGNVNSGFAYSLECSKDQIYTAHHGCVLPMDRVPTVLLLNKDGNFDLFGTSARDKYTSLSLQDKHKDYSYFDNLEVVPGEQLTEYIVKDRGGKSVEAEQIYATVIRYFYKLAIANIPNNAAKSKRVRVVLTVPSCCGDYMWDIVHAAARSVGIEEELICFIFNGDATALYCSKQNLFVDTYLTTSKIKTKYILMNLGGLRTEILVKHFYGSTWKEFPETFTVSCGGKSVSEFFLTVLGSVKDKKEWSKFQRTCIYDYECIKLHFEKFKHKFDGTGKFILELPVSFCKLPENNDGKQSIIDEEIVYVADNKIVLTKEVMEKLFQPTIEQIVNKLKAIRETTGQGGEEVTILIAGGFSESSYVRKVISREMNPSKVLLLPNANLDVLKGAVMIGYEKFRRSKYSYGLMLPVPFNQSELQENTEKEKPYKFREIIQKRQMLQNERVYVEKITKSTNGRYPIEVDLYKTKKAITGIVFLKNKDIEFAGRVQIKPLVSGWLTKSLSCELKIIVKDKGFKLVFIEQESKWEGVTEVPY